MENDKKDNNTDCDESDFYDYETTEQTFGGTTATTMTKTNDDDNEKLPAALEQAQVTAAILTNWAGRAFRRAMEEVNGEKIKPILPKSPPPPPTTTESMVVISREHEQI